jgi:archaeal type IV pilus assembly protein PilA
MKHISINNERAVSPVVGVMLMLVVTIIIAAVVSAFAGGMGGGAKTAPQASIMAKSFEVKYANNMTVDATGHPASDIYVVFENRGGEAVNLNKIQIKITDSGYPNQAAVVSNSVAPYQLANITGNKGSTKMSDFSRSWTKYLEGFPDHTMMISPGSQFVMHADAISDRYVSLYPDVGSPAHNPAIYWINSLALSNANNQPVYSGDYLLYEIIDKDSGKAISSGRIMIPLYTLNHDLV